ncbi:hypothetical protein GCM10027047_12020 [Rhodococcus aerolatus]
MTALLLFLLNLAWLVLIARVLVDVVGAAVPAGGLAHPPLVRVRSGLHRVTEPVLAPLRRVLPTPRLGPVVLDLSVAAVLVGIAVLRVLLRG